MALRAPETRTRSIPLSGFVSLISLEREPLRSSARDHNRAFTSSSRLPFVQVYLWKSRAVAASTDGMSFAPPRTSARSARTTHVRWGRRSSRDCARRGVAALDLLPLRRPTRERAASINPTTRSYRRRYHCHHHHRHRHPTSITHRDTVVSRLPISRPSASSGPRSAAGSPSRSPTPEPTFAVPRSPRSRRLVPAPSYPPPISLRSFLTPDKAPSLSRSIASFSFFFVRRIKFLSDHILICFCAL